MDSGPRQAIAAACKWGDMSGKTKDDHVSKTAEQPIYGKKVYTVDASLARLRQHTQYSFQFEDEKVQKDR